MNNIQETKQSAIYPFSSSISANQTPVLSAARISSGRPEYYKHITMPPVGKYPPYAPPFKVDLKDRTWPDKQITESPTGCPVDMRDSNQALVCPMNFGQKLAMFLMLKRMGFKEIEVGNPAASQVDYDFIRYLIETPGLLDGVTIQVLALARKDIIEKTMEAIKGAPSAIVHLYNPTSKVQRELVLKQSKEEVKANAVEAVTLLRELAEKSDTKITLQYSPESFTATEMDFAIEICQAVMRAWGASPERKVILNLPATVELCWPDEYADLIEYFCRNLKNRESTIISVHPHNDCGCAVAAAILACKAGADRVEGTIDGGGERSGNLNLTVFYLNLYTQGIDPGVYFGDMPRIKKIVEACTGMKIPPRTPYMGELVFKAFSGTHQFAIRQALLHRQKTQEAEWNVPYLKMDPADLSQTLGDRESCYRDVIGITQQSGKHGAAFVLNAHFGCALPKAVCDEFGAVVKALTNKRVGQVSADDIWEAFAAHFINQQSPYQLIGSSFFSKTNGVNEHRCEMKISHQGEVIESRGEGAGPIEAAKSALINCGCPEFDVVNLTTQARQHKTESDAVSYVEVKLANGVRRYGVGIDRDSQLAAVKAMFSAINRAVRA